MLETPEKPIPMILRPDEAEVPQLEKTDALISRS